MAANLKSEAFLDAQFQLLPSYVDYNKSLADGGFKFALGFLEKNHKGKDPAWLLKKSFRLG